ncbi:MAG: polymer-forming cytoskeletal protein [Myxococcales bacterium]|nr:polymer-forming cytoskeletal protein [Myxococcales bacterium]
MVTDEADDPVLELDTLLGRGTHFEGKLTFDGHTRLDGTVRGEVFSNGVLVIGDGADVDATVDVRVLIVRGGVLRGTIRARESIEVYASARVYGSLAAPEVVIEKGAVIEGSVRMGPADEAPRGTGD